MLGQQLAYVAHTRCASELRPAVCTRCTVSRRPRRLARPSACGSGYMYGMQCTVGYGRAISRDPGRAGRRQQQACVADPRHTCESRLADCTGHTFSRRPRSLARPSDSGSGCMCGMQRTGAPCFSMCLCACPSQFVHLHEHASPADRLFYIHMQNESSLFMGRVLA